MAEQKKLSLKDLVQEAHAAVVSSPVVAIPRAVSNHTGAAPIHAAIRQGARELAPLLQAFPDSNVRATEEQGNIFSPTPQLVTQQITGKLSMDDLRSYAKDKAQEASQRMEKGQDKGMEM
jgi:hypothetical protein